MSEVIHQNYDPLVSPFESVEQEARYTAWLNAKFEASVNDPRPNIAHDDAMAKIKLLLACPATHAAN